MLGHPNAGVILKCDEYAANISLILLVLLNFDEMLKLEYLGIVGFLDGSPSLLEQVQHFVVVEH